MLSNQEDFDRDVKRVLQEVNGEEIPQEFLVDIEQRLDQLEKKKKRRVLIWFFTGIVLASGLTFGLLHGNGSVKNHMKTATQKNPKDTIKAASIPPKASPKEYKSIQAKTVQIAKTQPSGVTRNTLSNSPIKETVTHSFGQNKSDLMHTAIPVDSSTSVQTQQAIMETHQDAPVLLSDRKTAISPSSDSVKVELPMHNEPSKEEVSPAINIPEIVMKNDLPKWTHSFGFYTGMSGLLSSFQTDNQSLIASVGATNALKYRELRSTQERSTSSIDISLRYRMAREHLVLQTGVDFFEWGEQIQYDYSFVYDGVNRYSYLSLPVYLGYRQAFSSFEWSANIGCSVGHVLQQQGRYIQPDLVTLALENARTWTATGMAQVEFIYIFDRYRFSLAPTYRMSLGNVVNSAFTKNRYFSFGLQMGMAYQF